MNTHKYSDKFFTGTVWLAILGGISGLIYYLLKEFADLVTRYFLTSVTLDNNNEAFQWIVRWIADKKGIFNSQNLTLHLSRQKKKTSWGYTYEDKSEKPSIEFLPGPGYHVFNYKGKLIWMSRYSSGWDKKPFIFEQLHLSTLGRNKQIFQELFNEARNACLDKERMGTTRVYVLNEYGYAWMVALTRPTRDFSSVILDKTMSQDLLKDAQLFLQRKKWYHDMGLPYRRGYLLYGKPGCGKTSYVCALAGKLNLDICVLNLSSNTLDDQMLNQRLHDAPSDAVILLEDVDAVFVDRHTAEDADGKKRVTFSGLLNAIDGVASQEGKLFFMTTNHIEKLDPALIRPGRCDIRVEFTLATKHQIHQMFLKFYPTEKELAEKFASSIPENTISMASLQKHFMANKDKPQKALDESQKLLEENDNGEENTVDITIWLKRLGLSEYIEIFKKQCINKIQDLENIDENLLIDNFKMKYAGERALVLGMLEGKKYIKKDFELAPELQIRKYILKYYQNESSDIIEKLVKSIPPNTVSILQLRKHFSINKSAEEALKNINLLLNPPTTFINTEKNYKKETLHEWIKRNKLEEEFSKKFEEDKQPTEKIKKDIPEEVNDNLEKNIIPEKQMTILQKFEEEGIEDTDDLIELSESDFEEFGIKSKGVRLQIMNDIERLAAEKKELNDDDD